MRTSIFATRASTTARGFPAAEQRAFFHDNAVRIYDMEKR
jgi:predicted TIM-barrel fold metal-dependent hydrolase